MMAGPFKYIEWGYIRGFEKAGCKVLVWDSKDMDFLDEILTNFRPDAFIGYLRGSKHYNYLNFEWCEGKIIESLMSYRKNNGLKVALHTHPDVQTMVKKLNLKLMDGDSSGADKFYKQPPPPTVIERRLVEEQFIDFILHPYSAEITRTCFTYWADQGIKVIEEPLAADDTFYKPPYLKRNKNYDICYIGGWWPFKGIQLDRYLLLLSKHFGNNLAIFGKGWTHLSQGIISDRQYKKIVWRSKINLVFHEPSQVQGIPIHLNERIFKLYALGAFAICDNNLCLKEYFKRDEIVMACCPEQLIDLCKFYLTHKEARDKIANKGREAVLKKHTYKKRAERLLNFFKRI